MKKLKISITELVFYSLSAALGLWGLVYTVLGLVANNLKMPLADNKLKMADNAIAQAFGLGFLPWGLIIFSIGALMAFIVLMVYSKSADRDFEKQARRAARVNRNTFKKEAEVVEAPVEK